MRFWSGLPSGPCWELTMFHLDLLVGWGGGTALLYPPIRFSRLWRSPFGASISGAVPPDIFIDVRVIK